MHANLISDVESVNKDKYKKSRQIKQGESGIASIEA